MKELTAMDDFNGDPALKFSSREALKFYKQLAESDIPQIRDYFIVEENFQRKKKNLKKSRSKNIHSRRFRHIIKKQINTMMH
jgi:hypothetical protein